MVGVTGNLGSYRVHLRLEVGCGHSKLVEDKQDLNGGPSLFCMCAGHANEGWPGILHCECWAKVSVEETE